MENRNNTILKHIIDLFPVIASHALVFRSIIPMQLPLFFMLLAVYYFNFFVSQTHSFSLSQVRQASRSGFWPLIIGVVYLLIIALSGSTNELPVKEAFRTGTVLLLFVTLMISSQQQGFQKSFQVFKTTYLVYLLILVFLLVYRMVWSGDSIFKVMKSMDYNMLAMYLLVGIVLLVVNIQELGKRVMILVGLNIYLILLVGLLVLTASRRGLIALGILLFVSLLVLIVKKIFATWFKKLAVFNILLFSMLFGAFLLLKQPAIRQYLVLENPDNSLVNRINSVFNRYYSISNQSGKSFTYFSEPTFLNKVIGKKLESKLYNKPMADQEYYLILNQLAYFVPNRGELQKLYTGLDQLHDSVFEQKLLPKLPAYFNVDFTFSHWFVPAQLNNCSLLSYDLAHNDSVFHFRTLNSHQQGSFMIALPIMDSSVFYYEFTFYDKTKLPEFRLNISETESDNIKILQDTLIHKNDSSLIKRVVIETKQINGLYLHSYLAFQPGEFYLSDIRWSRKRNSKTIVRDYSRTNYRLDYREANLNKLLPVVQRADNFEPDCNQLAVAHESLVKAYSFGKYKQSKVVESDAFSSKFLPSGEKHGFVRKVVPAIPGAIYVLSYHINVPYKDLNFYVKRYPESNPDYLKHIKLSDTQITPSENGVHIQDSIKIIDCSSLLALMVIGARSADTVQISNFEYKMHSCNQDKVLNKTQKRHAFNLMQSASILSEKLAQNDQQYIHLHVRDSLQNYYNFWPNISDTLLSSTRTERWKFAWAYFKKLPLQQKLFGDRLAYLDLYPQVFYSNKRDLKSYDYPHNPVISTFLYSGIFGGLLYVYFLMLVFYQYFTCRKELGVYLILYLLTFAFAFFSGNSHFSIPLFAIFSLLPFLFDRKSMDKNTLNT
jgi:hypothetical protein